MSRGVVVALLAVALTAASSTVGIRTAAAGPARAVAGRTASVDPGRPGNFSTVSGEYSLPDAEMPGLPGPVEMRAVVVAPRDAPGRRPLVLFLHGSHATCFQGPELDGLTMQWPCPTGTEPVPSYRGFLATQQLLASQGYVTVSISANGVNALDGDGKGVPDDPGTTARSALVRRHLTAWAGWASGGAPAVVRAASAADLSRVVLVGHSRGGEGVNRAAMDSLTPPPAESAGKMPWTVRGIVLVAPTDGGQNPVADLPSVVILAGCDGDVSNLEGQMYVDATRDVGGTGALHSAVYVVGANHNYFNSEWTPGESVAPATDDAAAEGDTVCSPGASDRLTAGRQRQAGTTYIAAAAAVFANGDERALPLIDGSGSRAPSIDPSRVFVAALGARRVSVLLPGPALGVTGAGRTCAMVTRDRAAACTADTATFPNFGFSPVMGRQEPDRYAVAMSWPDPGGLVSLRPQSPLAIGDATDLALRVIVPANSAGTRFGVTVVDESGRRTGLGEVGVDGLPSSGATVADWAQEVRVPLRGVASVAAVELTPNGGEGRAWLLDASAWKPGLAVFRKTSPPRVDLGEMTVTEGDSGTAEHRIPVTVTGSGEGQVRLLLARQEGSVPPSVTSWVADVHAGDRTIDVPVPVTGDEVYTGDVRYSLTARAARGTMIGDYSGSLTVEDDDPAPTVTVATPDASTAEGGMLTWRVSLSETVGTDITVSASVVAPATGPEVSTTDVDPAWFASSTFGRDPQPSRPLSEAFPFVRTAITAGTLDVDIAIPVVADDLAEPAEQIALTLFVSVGGAPVTLPTLTGTVTNQPSRLGVTGP